MSSIYKKQPVQRDSLSPYTYAEASAVLRVCERTIRKWVRANLIRSISVGPRLVMIPASEVVRVAQEGLKVQ